MTTIVDLSQTEVDLHILGPFANLFAFASVISSSDTDLVWKSAGLANVALHGSGIIVDTSGHIVGGTVHSLALDLNRDGDFSTGSGVDLTITGLSVQLSDLIAGSTVDQQADNFWSTLLAGSQVFNLSGQHWQEMFGDARELVATTLAGATGVGSADVFHDHGNPATGGSYTHYVVAGDIGELIGYASGTDVGLASYVGGNDTIYADGDSGHAISGDAGRVDSRSELNGGDDRLFLAFSGTNSDQVLIDLGKVGISGDAQQNAGEVFGGDDRIIVAAGTAQFALGIAGDVFLNGGILHGGNDTIVGAAMASGDAKTSGGTVYAGNDVLIGDTGDSKLWGDVADYAGGYLQAGSDSLNGGGGTDYLIGDAERFDYVIPATSTFLGGSDTLDGGSQNDYLVGDLVGLTIGQATGGDDVLIGGTGNDGIIGDFRFDGGYLQSASYYKGSYVCGADVIDGGSGNDHIVGDTWRIVSTKTLSLGNDTIHGGAGNDVIYGDVYYASMGTGVQSGALIGGDDVISGDAGADLLVGGFGADRFEYSDSDLNTVAHKWRDTIQGLDSGDRIDLSMIDANATIGGDQAFVFDTDGKLVAGEIAIKAVAGGFLLQAEVDGKTGVDLSILLTSVDTWNAGQFIL